MLRNSTARFLIASATVAIALASCAEEETSHVVQPLDLERVDGLEEGFDKNAIVDTASLTDVEAIDAKLIDSFLQKTPYARPSFLSTYQSNGVRAADAIARAARTYGINPIVFLVFAQTTQGLIGERNYPFPPERVEYVFQCGCLRPGKCLPELAGFDRQVDCLGRTLRDALDAIAENQQTAAGWGPDITTTTLDGQKVTPADEGTAVVYDRRPIVAEGKTGGAWIFWNVWHLYAIALDYFGPVGGEGFGAWIGDACTSDKSCGYEGAICDTSPQYPDGLCSLECDGTCPSQPDLPDAFCAAFPEGGFCFQVCNLGAPACRDGYECKSVIRFNGEGPNDSSPVCYPKNIPN
jgi:hypothetical protein